MTPGSLTGRHALVTGAGGGIGSAIARQLVAAGARVSLAGRNAERLAATAAELPADQVQVIDGFDVTSPEAIAAGAARARADFGPVGILVNNAGEAPSAPFADTSFALWSQVLATDLSGVFLVTQEFLADLKSQANSRIVTIASTAGLTGYRYVSAYCAAKHGVVGLTRALALELARTGVTVNAVCPGFVDTPLIDRAVETIVEKTGRSEAEARAQLASANPQGRLVRPEEVADAVLWLSEPGAASVTGQAIVVAGGEILAG